MTMNEGIQGWSAMQVASERSDSEPEPDQHGGARRDAKLGTPVSPLPYVTPPGPGAAHGVARGLHLRPSHSS